MSFRITRRELYELVWSQPMRTVAATVGFSDVAVAKACRHADIPVPERGYWAKKQAGKHVIKRPLPARFPGASELVEMGGRSWGYQTDADIVNGPVPPAPTFDEELSTVIERIHKMVGKVICPRTITNPHRFIAVLLDRDAAARASPHGWERPEYESPTDKRRLRILNALFTAAARLGCPASMTTAKYAGKGRETSITVGDQTISFTLAPIEQKRRLAPAPAVEARERLRLSMPSRRYEAPVYKSWEDSDDGELEEKLTEILTEMLIAAERFHREGAMAAHQWQIQRKAQLEEQARKQKEEAERRARELLAKQAQERIDRLLGQAANLHRAATIRRYADAVLERSAEVPLPPHALERWAAWARSEADRIDPVKNGTVAEAVEGLIRSLEPAAADE